MLVDVCVRARLGLGLGSAGVYLHGYTEEEEEEEEMLPTQVLERQPRVDFSVCFSRLDTIYQISPVRVIDLNMIGDQFSRVATSKRTKRAMTTLSNLLMFPLAPQLLSESCHVGTRTPIELW